MNSCWRRSLWSRRTTSGHPRRPLLLPSRNRSRKTPGQRRPRAVVMPPINSWRILPTKSISLALASSHQGFGRAVPNAQPPASVAKPEAAPPQSGESGPLKEVCDECRAELGEMGVEDEDLETHYNLGIAFREMGLLEEAISEFQKVAKANAHGRAFRYTMQCCTLLGLAFMEKGQPAIAAIWYERALETPGNDPESTLALRYDLGVAQESAGEPEAALKSFSQVYAMNIDYRGVAERIAALQKPIR